MLPASAIEEVNRRAPMLSVLNKKKMKGGEVGSFVVHACFGGDTQLQSVKFMLLAQKKSRASESFIWKYNT